MAKTGVWTRYMTTKALVIDDSKVARMIMKKVLSAIKSDWEIVEAGDAEEALAMVETTAIDMFFIDVNMPGMSGIELAGILRERFPETPMTMVTANVQESIQQQAAEIGIPVIGKPFNEEKLAETRKNWPN